MIRVLHIITGLNLGGAEMSLYKLIANIDRSRFQNSVVALLCEGPVGDMIRDEGIDVECLGYKQGVPNPLMLVDVTRIIGKRKPDVIQTWMYHANLVGGIASLFVKRTPVIWGIRHNELPLDSTKRSTRAVASVCAWASPIIPCRIVLNSQKSRDYHSSIGYNPAKMHVIPNGFDLDVFRPDPEQRRASRANWGITDDSMVVGTVGRFHADKDIRTFLEAAGIISKRRNNIRFILCGSGFAADNSTLMQWIDELGLKSCVRLLGRLKDIPAAMNGFDIFTLSSVTESFPNVVGEAMACGLPCVVTDVGDTKLILGDTGFIVRPKNPSEIAQAWSQIVDMDSLERTTLGAGARHRVTVLYDIKNMVTGYEAIYEALE